MKKYKQSGSTPDFTPRTAMEEAARCLLCYDAPCSKSCPAGTDPARFIRAIRFRNVKGAAAVIRENNILGACCANVCPCDQLCEEACSRSGLDRPIRIGQLQRYAAEAETVYGMKVLSPGSERGAKVACVGAGPASLSAAAELRKLGYDVTIYDANEKPGGYLTYGISKERLAQSVVDADISKVVELGVNFKMSTRVGTDVKLEDLRENYDAVFLGIGLWKANIPDIPGNQLPGVMSGIDFLRKSCETGDGVSAGKRIIVIGGGDVALDCASTALLAGAEKVAVWYRRSLREAPADQEELCSTVKLGVSITTDMAPVEIIGTDAVTGIRFRGRDGVSSAAVSCDTVIFATGQSADTMLCEKLELTEKGLVAAQDGRTSLPGVFAAGDVVHGGKTVAAAVGAGKQAAHMIHSFLTEREAR